MKNIESGKVFRESREYGHSAKHAAADDTALLDELLSSARDPEGRPLRNRNAFLDGPSARETISEAMYMRALEIAAWMNGEHEVPEDKRLELHITNFLTREDVDDPDYHINDGPAYSMTSDDIRRTQNSSIHLVLDPLNPAKNMFKLVTAFPDVNPDVSYDVPCDLTDKVRKTEAYRKAEPFQKAVYEYMAADKPADRPHGGLTNDRRGFFLVCGEPRHGARMTLFENGTIRLYPNDKSGNGPKSIRFGPKNMDLFRKDFPQQYDILSGIKARAERLGNDDGPLPPKQPPKAYVRTVDDLPSPAEPKRGRDLGYI